MQNKKVKKVFLGLPAYNEEKSIKPLFEKILMLKQKVSFEVEVLFYDDGCTDDTKVLVNSWMDRLSINYIDGVVNKGLGMGMNQILNCFLRVSKENDVLVVMDCDDTHDPAQIPQMIQILETDSKISVVIASRYRKNATIKGVALHMCFYIS